MSDAIACATPIVDDSPQDLEEPRRAVNLVDHHELAGMSTEVEVRVFQAASVSSALEIEIECGIVARIRDGASERRFSDLAWAEENDARSMSQAFNDGVVGASRNHARKSNASRYISGG